MTLTLRLAKEVRVPLDSSYICPDKFAEKTLHEIGELAIWEGNRKGLLKDVFSIEGSSGKKPDEVTINLHGDLSKSLRIGTKMTAGSINIQGSVGMHTGEEMQGGKITVDGNAGSWLGSRMKGGTIEVKRDAGDYVGAPYRGSTTGMKGGTIHIHGNAGTEVGSYMGKGLIKIDGNVDQFVGIHQKDGIILVRGNARGRAGAYMRKGKIIICGNVKSVLPTFSIDSIKNKAKIDGETINEPFYMFIGDHAEGGTGKLYISKSKNRHLETYEKML
ncbi:MAG: formylmethanofuran dehydrogenase subunit C [Candidatus Bathyarchaeota archaeon]|nr:formylmethanofuran dehydrogenase subunit C [Candidatus Bathyarchaeota archaeon]